jgi:MFS family permease
MVSALLILNTLSVMLFQVRVARRVNGLPSATRLLRYSGLVMLVSCGVFALTAVKSGAWAAAAILAVAAVLQVVAEMMQASATWQISFDLAPPEKQGQYQGLFGTSTAVARMAGPILLTTLIIGLGTPGWLILGVLFLGAALAMGPAVRWAEATRPAPAT